MILSLAVLLCADAAPLERATWADYQHHPDRQTKLEGSFVAAPAVAWSVRLPGPRLNSASHTERSSPVVLGNEILVGSASGKALYRLDRFDGATVGQYPANASVEAEALVDADRVFFADTSGTTWCYDLDGKKLWENRGNAPILTRPTLADGRVFVTNVDDLVVALDASTGEQIWRYKAKKDLTRVAELSLYAAPSALVEGSEVIVGFSSGRLVGLDAESGEELWGLGAGEGRYPDLVATPTVSGEDLFVSGYFKPLLAIDRSTHTVRWRADVGAAFPVLVRDGVVFHPGTDGQMRAFSALTGAEKWRWDSGTGTALTEPVYTPAGLIVGASGGSIYLVDAVDGHLKWTWSEPSLLLGVTATPLVVDRQLLFVTNAGELYSLIVQEDEARKVPSGRRPWDR